MKQRFIATFDPLVETEKTINLPKGKYSHLLIVYSGDAAAGVTIAASGLGTVRLNRNGQDLVNVDAEFFHELGDLRGGFLRQTSAAGGAFVFDAVIPFSLPSLPNVLDLRSSEEAYLTLRPTGIDAAAEVDSASVTVYGILEPVQAETYTLRWFNRDMTVGGAVRDSEVINHPNIVSAFFRDASSIVSRLTLSRDNEVVFDADDAVLASWTAYVNKIEATGNTIGEIAFVTSDISEVFSGDFTAELQSSGAGTLEIWICAVEFANSAKLSESRSAALENVARSVRSSRAPAGDVAIASQISPRLSAANPVRRGI